MMTACAPPSCAQQVSFTLGEANRILDSLQARGDWQRMFALQTARLNNSRQEVHRLEEIERLAAQQQRTCDSTRLAYNDRVRILTVENMKVRRKLKRTPTMLTIAFTFGIIVTLLLQ